MRAIILKPARTAMQSGMQRTKKWRMVFEEQEPKFVEPLMGWVGGRDTMQQIDLWFDSREEAIAYAKQRGITYTDVEKPGHKVKPSSYADNFRYDKIKAW